MAVKMYFMVITMVNNQNATTHRWTSACGQRHRSNEHGTKGVGFRGVGAAAAAAAAAVLLGQRKHQTPVYNNCNTINRTIQIPNTT
jgi:hypothetical protein